MTHARQDIREQIAEQLRTEFANVFTSRAKVLFDQDMPAVLVYTTNFFSEIVLNFRFVCLKVDLPAYPI